MTGSIRETVGLYNSKIDSPFEVVEGNYLLNYL